MTNTDINPFSGLENKPENERTALGRRLREARESQLVSRNQVAKVLGTSLSTVQAWEAGDREPDSTKLSLFSRHFGIAANWLLFGVGPMKTETAGLPPWLGDDDTFPFDEQAFRERLQTAINVYPPFSFEGASKQSGVSKVDLRRYVAGEGTPGFAEMAKLALAVGVSVDWLATGEGEMRRKDVAAKNMAEPPASDHTEAAPGVEPTSAIVHVPQLTNDTSAPPVPFRRSWLAQVTHVNPDDLATMTVNGDAMAGLLNDRDIVLINRAQATGDGLYALRIGDDLMVKRVQRLPNNRLRISSADEAYAPFDIEIGAASEVEVIGRVIWFGRAIA